MLQDSYFQGEGVERHAEGEGSHNKILHLQVTHCNIARNIQSVSMRLVLDTATMVAAIRSNAGASNRLLAAGLERRLIMLVSTPLLIEYEAVMTREEHLAASGLTADEVGAVLDAVAATAEPVRLAFLWRPAVRDADDDMVLETATNGQAEAIVTFNRRDFAKVAERFGVEVLLPGEALQRLEMGR
jgi:putative PIN family toxin of toxin-antitoxin system